MWTYSQHPFIYEKVMQVYEQIAYACQSVNGRKFQGLPVAKKEVLSFKKFPIVKLKNLKIASDTERANLLKHFIHEVDCTQTALTLFCGLVFENRRFFNFQNEPQRW